MTTQAFIQWFLNWFAAWFPPPPPELHIEWSIGPVSEQFPLTPQEPIMLTLTDSQKCSLGPIQAVDAKGNTAPIDGVPTWVSSDATVLTVEPSTDGLSAVVKAVGPLGNAQVTVTADADLGTGVVNVVGLLDVTVVAGQAVSLTVPVGTPEENV